jgi:hypothetical protein
MANNDKKKSDADTHKDQPARAAQPAAQHPAGPGDTDRVHNEVSNTTDANDEAVRSRSSGGADLASGSAHTDDADAPKIQPSVHRESQHEVDEDAKRKENEQATKDRFAAMHGQFLNELDALGSSKDLSMARAHAKQAMEWVGRHLHPSSGADIPEAPPAAPPIVE